MEDLLKVSISGVRGVVGTSITPQVVTAFAQAFGGFVGRGQVLIGRDTRPSGALFEQAVVAGLLSVGCRPVRLGIVPTPSLLFLVKDLGALGGIAITASHNPSEWNALKFVDRNGLFLDNDQAQEVFDIYHQQISEGNLIWNIRKYWDEIAYFQIGDVPGRREPLTGEINYRNVFGHIHARGWTGVLGMEHGNSRPGAEGERAVLEAYRAADGF